MKPTSRRRAVAAGGALAALVTLTTLSGLSGSGVAGEKPREPGEPWSHLSSAVGLHAWIANPDLAPEPMREKLEGLRRAVDSEAGSAALSRGSRNPDARGRFNTDTLGLPQNEESLTVCRSNPRIVLGGTNDFRGLLDPDGNFTGWHFSNNGGRSLTNEGLLPPVSIAGALVPSGGDPVSSHGDHCGLYAASLNYDPVDPLNGVNGIGVYQTTPSLLASCPGGTDDSCWPNRRAVATGAPGHFLDKEWMTVGRSGAAGQVVWVTYTDFTNNDQAPLGFDAASIFAVRCDAALSSCTEPIEISGADKDVQFSDVTVGQDGRTYVSWSEIQGELELTPQTFVHKLRVAEPGSTSFGPTRVIATEPQAVPFGGVLNANDFRIATYLKSDVALVDGRSRVFATWESCGARILGENVCESARINLTWSDDLGASWQGPVTVSGSGQNYFPTLSVDRTNGKLALAWFTSRYDPVFDNRQDVQTLVLDASRPDRRGRFDRLTQVSNEPEADPVLGGFFIGDYIEVVAHGGRTYVHFNANYTRMLVLGEGFPVPQQDNVLVRTRQ